MSAITEDLKQHIDIIDVVGRYVDLKRAGSNYTGLCPFHREKSPSFMVSRDKQIYKCFGCGLGGDSISFMMEYEKIDFWDAIKELAARYHFDLAPYKSERSSIEGYLDTKDQREKVKLINKITTKRFQEQLTQSPEASDYITSKRNIDQEISNRWQLGYAPMIGSALPQHLQSKGFTSNDCIEAGLVKKSTSNNDVYSFFRHRLIFPIHDHVGNVVGFGGRIINPEDNPKYLNTTETNIYQKSKVLYGLYQAKNHIKTENKVIIVEGYMDVIALDRLNLPIGVAPCGTSLTIDHIKLLTRHTSNIITLFDNDNAGQAASMRSIKLMLEQGIYPQIIKLPHPYKDIDDLANAPITEEEKQDILSHTIDRFTGLLHQLQGQYPIDHPVATKQLLHEMFTILTSINDYSVFLEYMSQLAQITNKTDHGLLGEYKARYHTTNKHTGGRTTQVANQYEEDINLLISSLPLNPIYQQKQELYSELYDIATNLIKLSTPVEYTSSQLEEGNLRRSRTLEQLTTDKHISQIQQFLNRYIQTNTQLIIKSNKLTLDEKQAILTRIKKSGNQTQKS